MKRLLLLILAFGLFAGAAYASNGIEHVIGAVTAITDTSISVKTIDGTVQTVLLSNDTKFLKGTTAIVAKDIKVGDHIVIHATKKEGKLVAPDVKVGAMKAMHGRDMSSVKAQPHYAGALFLTCLETRADLLEGSKSC